MRTIPQPVLPFSLTKSSQAWKNERLQCKVCTKLPPTPGPQSTHQRSQITGSTKKGTLCLIRGRPFNRSPQESKEIWTSKWKIYSNPRNCDFFREEKKLLGWYHPKPRVMYTPIVSSTDHPARMRFWNTSKWLYNSKMFFSNSQT